MQASLHSCSTEKTEYWTWYMHVCMFVHVWAGVGGALCTTCMCGQGWGEHYASHACSMLATPCAAALVPATNLECYLYVALCTNRYPTTVSMGVEIQYKLSAYTLQFSADQEPPSGNRIILPGVTGMPSIRTQSAGKGTASKVYNLNTYSFCLDSAVGAFLSALLIDAAKYPSSFSKEATTGFALLCAPVK